MAVTTSPEAEETITELLARLFHQSCVSFTDAEQGTVRVSVFLARRKRPGGLLKQRILTGLRTIKGWGLSVGAGRVSCRRVRPQDWTESWKRHFKPMEFGDALLVKPSWSKCRAKRGQDMVVLDPGLSFGTGQHPTTAFCLEQLVRFRPTRMRQCPSFLDIGTGSGILAIAAARLGFGPIDAFDFDSVAVRVARENARANAVTKRVHFFRGDVLKSRFTNTRGKYRFVCANLTADLLLKARDGIVGTLDTDGVLVLAGILKTEFRNVQIAYEAAHLRLLTARAAGEWRSGAFVRKTL